MMAHARLSSAPGAGAFRFPRGRSPRVACWPNVPRTVSKFKIERRCRRCRSERRAPVTHGPWRMRCRTANDYREMRSRRRTNYTRRFDPPTGMMTRQSRGSKPRGNRPMPRAAWSAKHSVSSVAGGQKYVARPNKEEVIVGRRSRQ